MKILHILSMPNWIAAAAAILIVQSPAGAWQKILPHHFGRYHVPPSVYGYDLDITSPGYYGGLGYREYYSFQRGSFLAQFPGTLPVNRGRWLRWRQWPYSEHRHGAPLPADCACITVNVPADAEVWLEGKRSSQTGSSRHFISPPLAKRGRYVYTIRARWNSPAGLKESTREVLIQAGHRVTVTFVAVPGPQPATLPLLLSPPAPSK